MNLNKCKYIIILLILSSYSCKKENNVYKKDYSSKYANLNTREIDSIYSSNIDQVVFLSFYPDMHYDIYERQLKKELYDNDNLSDVLVIKSDESSYIGYFLNNYGSKSSSKDGNFKYEFKFSVDKYYVNLKSRGFLSFDSQDMIINLFKERYGQPKEIVINETKYILFRENKKYITINNDNEYEIDIKYWSDKSLEKFKNNKLKREKYEESFIPFEKKKSINQI